MQGAAFYLLLFGCSVGSDCGKRAFLLDGLTDNSTEDMSQDADEVR